MSTADLGVVAGGSGTRDPPNVGRIGTSNTLMNLIVSWRKMERAIILQLPTMRIYSINLDATNFIHVYTAIKKKFCKSTYQNVEQHSCMKLQAAK